MLKPETIAYFQPLINAAKSPKDLADMIEKDHSSARPIPCNNAIQDLQAITGKYYSNYIDTAYAAINQMTGIIPRPTMPRATIASINGVSDYSDRLRKSTPTCTCDSKALFDSGCTCAYSVWKAEQRAMEKFRDEFHRFVTENPTATPIIATAPARDEIKLTYAPQQRIDLIDMLHGKDLDLRASMSGLTRGSVETDVEFRERINIREDLEKELKISAEIADKS